MDIHPGELGLLSRLLSSRPRSGQSTPQIQTLSPQCPGPWDLRERRLCSRGLSVCRLALRLPCRVASSGRRPGGLSPRFQREHGAQPRAVPPLAPGSVWGSPSEWGWGPRVALHLCPQRVCTEGLGGMFGSKESEFVAASVLLRCPTNAPAPWLGPQASGSTGLQGPQQGWDKSSVGHCSHHGSHHTSGREGRGSLPASVQQRECPTGWGAQCGGQMARRGAQVGPGSRLVPAQRCCSQEGFQAVRTGPAATLLPTR